MASMEREFYRGARGPAPSDTDFWRLVLDDTGKHLVVRHEWRTARHSGSNDFTLADFLGQEGAARDALIRLLFEEATPTPEAPKTANLLVNWAVKSLPPPRNLV